MLIKLGNRLPTFFPRPIAVSGLSISSWFPCSYRIWRSVRVFGYIKLISQYLIADTLIARVIECVISRLEFFRFFKFQVISFNVTELGRSFVWNFRCLSPNVSSFVGQGSRNIGVWHEPGPNQRSLFPGRCFWFFKMWEGESPFFFHDIFNGDLLIAFPGNIGHKLVVEF